MATKHATEDVSRPQWTELFDSVTTSYEDDPITIEVLGYDIGDQFEVEDMPLEMISYDYKDDAVIISVGGHDPENPVVMRHIIEHPSQILADSLPPAVPWAFDITDQDGRQTIVQLHHRDS
jgi:hypothetical protein